ncbi:MAG TPA: hypothetical protein PLJ58_02020 [bacterium]|nr:hypothetical protein [bacterium]
MVKSKEQLSAKSAAKKKIKTLKKRVPVKVVAKTSVKVKAKKKMIEDDEIDDLLLDNESEEQVPFKKKTSPSYDESSGLNEVEEEDEEVKLTPKIRVNKLAGRGGVLPNDYVVAMRNKRSSYVEDSADMVDDDDELEEDNDEDEAPVVSEKKKTEAKKDLQLETDEDDDAMIIEAGDGPDELADLLPPDEIIAPDKLKLDKSSARKELPEQTELESGSEVDEHKARSVRIYKRIAVGFSVLVFIILLVVLYFALVKATISIALNEQVINDQVVIAVYDRPQDFSLPAKSVRGLVKTVAVEQSKLYQVSGHDVIGEEVVGQITLYNKYNKSQPLVASTRLLSASGKLYRLKNSVTVPAGGQVVADVYADQAKPEMAVGAELFTIPGLWEGLQDKIYGQSLEGAIKYQQKLRRIIAQDDIDKALADLKQVLKDKVKADFDNTYNDYDYKFYNLDELNLKFAVSGKVGEEKDQLPVSMSGTVEVIAFNSDQAQDLAKLSSAAKLPAGQDLLNLDTSNLKYELTKFDPNMVMAEVNMTYDVKVRANNKNEIVDKNKIIGLSEDQLKQYLSNIKDIRTYNIEFYPAFIKQVPRLTDRIEVKVVE